jgi:hypothetical protein
MVHVMLHTLSALDGFSLGAKDGDIGSVEDFYFDDEKWTIRYLAADTGTWLSGRKVLISPTSLGKAEMKHERIPVSLTREQIENCPHIDEHKPISRQYETELHDYYGYPYYWRGPYLWGPVAYPGALAVPPPTLKRDSQAKELNAIRERQRTQDQHLRSTREVTNYYIEASDGEIGHVEDFVLDDGDWAIRYIIVDTRNWWPGKKVLLSPHWISNVSWSESKARVELPRDRIRQAPEYDAYHPITREFEQRVYQHYERPAYW